MVNFDDGKENSTHFDDDKDVSSLPFMSRLSLNFIIGDA